VLLSVLSHYLRETRHGNAGALGMSISIPLDGVGASIRLLKKGQLIAHLVAGLSGICPILSVLSSGDKITVNDSPTTKLTARKSSP
jgi:hypothetical protein